MKKNFACIFLGLFLGLPVLVFGSADGTVIKEASSKNASLDPLVWDFGRVKEGSVRTHEFVLANDTPKTLKILSVATSCGCTVSKAKKEVLLSGESTILEVRFDSTGYHGMVRQFIYVATDNVDKSVVRYIIKAQVEK